MAGAGLATERHGEGRWRQRRAVNSTYDEAAQRFKARGPQRPAVLCVVSVPAREARCGDAAAASAAASVASVVAGAARAEELKQIAAAAVR